MDKGRINKKFTISWSCEGWTKWLPLLSYPKWPSPRVSGGFSSSPLLQPGSPSWPALVTVSAGVGGLDAFFRACHIFLNSKNIYTDIYILNLVFESKIHFFAFWPKFFTLQYVARPYISQNSSCPKSRLLCTQKKRIRTTVSTQQSKNRSEFSRPRNLPKSA